MTVTGDAPVDMHAETILVVSPQAGRGKAKKMVPAVVNEIYHQIYKPPVVINTDSFNADAMIKRYLGLGAEKFIALGGDGSVHHLLNLLAGTNATMGVIPAGSGNDFARGQGLHKGNLMQQVARATSFGVSTDLIQTSEGVWAGTAVIKGFPVAVNEAAEELKIPKILNGARYVAATLKQAPQLRIDNTHMEVDGVPYNFKASVVAVANTRYIGNGLDIAPTASPTDGEMAVCVIGDVHWAHLMAVFPTVMGGLHQLHPRVKLFSAKEVRITSHGPFRADGEHLGTGPVDLQTVPNAIRIAGANPPPPFEIDAISLASFNLFKPN